MKDKSKDAGIWILSSWQDLGLFVLSPLWVIPLLWMAKNRFDPNGFGAMLLAIGGTGHHLPGFIRAYTDPSLFRRFRTRFILAPVVFLAVYLLFFALHLESLKLLLILWGTWHGAMQVNGFLRIYDSKVGSFASVTSWLDWTMCLVWFGAGLLYSSRLISIFSHVFNIGAQSISPGTFAALRNAWMALAIGVTVAFLINAWKQAQAGKPSSPVKLLMMASSFALWWFAMVHVSSVLVGLLLFELIHDIQYNVLVWHYNARRVSQGLTASPVESVLFRPGLSRVLFYTALILAYGGAADVLGYVNVQAPSALQIGVTAVSFWTGLFMVSTFLHFYFDGFIWQVREKDFRQGMGIQAGAGTPVKGSSGTTSSGWLPPGWKWAFFVVPAAVLGAAEYRTTKLPLLEQARIVAEILPARWQASAVAGSLEKSAGAVDQAREHLQRAMALNPSYAYGEVMLGDIFSQRGESDLALQHYSRAVALNPQIYDAQYRLGKLLLTEGRIAEGIPHLQSAAQHQENANLVHVIGVSLLQEKKTLEGIPYLRRAVQLDPKHKEALNDLGTALQGQGDITGATGYYRRALEIDPGYSIARTNLERAEQLLLRRP